MFLFQQFKHFENSSEIAIRYQYYFVTFKLIIYFQYLTKEIYSLSALKSLLKTFEHAFCIYLIAKSKIFRLKQQEVHYVY